MSLTRKCVLAAISTCACATSAASFDCAKASTRIERLICADARLSMLDAQLAPVYRQALQIGDQEREPKLSQRAWIKRRDACADADCVATAYRERIGELEDALGQQLGADAIAGEYERDDSDYSAKVEPASISVKALPDGRVAISGEALWVGNVEAGNVHTGTLEGEFEVHAGTVGYRDGDAEGCRITLRFAGDALDALESHGYCGGMNVRFSGHYVKLR